VADVRLGGRSGGHYAGGVRHAAPPPGLVRRRQRTAACIPAGHRAQPGLKRWRRDHRLEPLDDEAFVAEPLAIEQQEIGELVARAVQDDKKD
jgi:hypothetical protein